MNSKNTYKYIYFILLLILIIGYILIKGYNKKFKYSTLFYIRMGILSFLFYILSDNLLYTVIFSIVILFAVELHHRNNVTEHLDNKEENIDLQSNRKAIDDFFEYGNKFLKNEAFINNYKQRKDNEFKNIDKLSKKVKTFQDKITKSLKK